MGTHLPVPLVHVGLRSVGSDYFGTATRMTPLDHTPVFSADPDLAELTSQAVATPSLEAAAALVVLADALLERGLIRAKPRTGGRAGRRYEASNRKYVCAQAYRWAAAQRWWPRWWVEKHGPVRRITLRPGDSHQVMRRGKVVGMTFHQNDRATTLPPGSYGASILLRRADGSPATTDDILPGDTIHVSTVAPAQTRQVFVLDVEES